MDAKKNSVTDASLIIISTLLMTMTNFPVIKVINHSRIVSLNCDSIYGHFITSASQSSSIFYAVLLFGRTDTAWGQPTSPLHNAKLGLKLILNLGINMNHANFRCLLTVWCSFH
jgi:hypothetical protein